MTESAPAQPNRRRRVAFREASVTVVLVLMMAGLALATYDRESHGSTFLTPSNLLDVALAFSFVAIMAVGETLVIISAGIDLSVGSNLALSGIVLALLLKAPWLAATGGLHIPLAIVGGLLTAVLVGLVNGLLVVRVRLTPFIATLGTLSVARGLAYALCRGWPVDGLPDGYYKGVGHAPLVHVPVAVWVMALVTAGGVYFLTQTRWGRHVYALGGNEEAARFAGIDVNRTKLLIYALCGLTCGVSATLMTAWLGVAQSTTGLGYELDVIAAAVIGGASLAGGFGSALGALLGAAIMGVLRNGLVLLNVPDYWQMVAVGTVIVVAVALDPSRKDR